MLRGAYNIARRWLSAAWPWFALLALSLAALLGSVRAREAFRTSSEARDAARRDAQAKAEEARRFAEALRDAQLAEADRERKQALEAGRAVADVEREHAERVAELRATPLPELVRRAQAAAKRSRLRRGAGPFLVVLAVLSASPVRAEPVTIDSEDLAQLVADSEQLEAVEPLYQAQIFHLSEESAQLRKALQTSTAATEMAVSRAVSADNQAAAARAGEKAAQKRTKWWGAGGVVAGVVATVLVVWASR